MGRALPYNLLAGFFDELSKIASVPAEVANRAYGLPLQPSRSKKPRYDHGSEQDAAYRSHSILFGDQNPNYTMSEIVTSPNINPGGV